MTTKTELINELSRLTGEKKKNLKNMKKEQLIIILKDKSKRKDLISTDEKHTLLTSSPKRRISRKSNRILPKRRKNVLLVSPKRRYKLHMKSSNRKSKSLKRSVTPYHRKRKVVWGGKHFLFGTPKQHRISSRSYRGILKNKRVYRTSMSPHKQITSSEKWYPKHGKHVWLKTPPKHLRENKRSRRKSRRSSRKEK